MRNPKLICGECLEDPALRATIAKADQDRGACSYCCTQRPTAPIEFIADACNEVLSHMYRVTSLERSVVTYERTPAGEPLHSVLESLLGAPEEALIDVEDALLKLWTDYELRESMYGEDPWFAEGSEYESAISSDWQEMEQSLRHEARLLNPKAAQMLEKVFGPVLDDRTRDIEPVIVEMSPASDLESLFRARVFQSDYALEKALRHPERFLGPPPEGLGAAGRMNSRGISVFYGATDAETALGEVRPPVGSKVTIAEFSALRPLRLLDLERLSSVTSRTDMSFFAAGAIERANRRNFLNQLTASMVMPVMPESQDQGYLITQAISDFLAMHPTLQLDGIRFRSSQGQRDIKLGMNVILFRKASVVEHSEESYTSTTQVQLWDEDENGVYFQPEIHTQHAVTPYRRLPELHFYDPPQEPALRLDRNSIEIREVTGVTFEARATPVAHSESTLKSGGSNPHPLDF